MVIRVVVVLSALFEVILRACAASCASSVLCVTITVACSLLLLPSLPRSIDDDDDAATAAPAARAATRALHAQKTVLSPPLLPHVVSPSRALRRACMFHAPLRLFALSLFRPRSLSFTLALLITLSRARAPSPRVPIRSQGINLTKET